MSGLRLLPLGVGSAFSARHYTTCLALESQGEWLLLDCPHPVRKMLREGGNAVGLALDLGNVRGVALSHLHADHCSGLEPFGFFSVYVLGRKAPLLAHPIVLDGLWSGALTAGMARSWNADGSPPIESKFEDFFDHVALDESAPVDFGPFRVECRRTIHTVPTTAFRVQAGGRTLGFSADTAFDRGLVDWLAEADLVVHEATHHDKGGLHTPYRDLVALPDEVRSKMRLVHCPDDFPGEGCLFPFLREGEWIDV